MLVLKQKKQLNLGWVFESGQSLDVKSRKLDPFQFGRHRNFGLFGGRT
jgi:hypothetical protein